LVYLAAPDGLGSLRMTLRASRAHILLAGILLVGFALRVAPVITDPDYFAVFDSGDYVRHAVSIAHGNGFPESAFTADGGPTAFRPPLYPYLLGFIYWVSGDSANVGRVVGCLFGVLGALLVYLIALELWDRRYALVAAALASLGPPLFFLGDSLINEPLFIALELAAVLFTLYSRRRGGSVGWAALAGLMVGLGALTRSNGLLLVLPLAWGVWVMRPRWSRKAVAAPIAMAAVAGVSMVPWMIRNTLEFDQFVSYNTQSGLAIAGTYNRESFNHNGYKASWLLPTDLDSFAYLANDEDLNEAELDRKLREEGFEFAWENPKYVVEATVINTLRLFEFAKTEPIAQVANDRSLGYTFTEARVDRAGFYLLLLAAGAGFLVMWRWPRERRPPGFIWIVPILVVVPVLPLFGSTRYRTPTYPFLVLAATPALIAGADRLRNRRRGFEVGGQAVTAGLDREGEDRVPDRG
jgi:4-amino-4-deoxy-L-arabinose transferase-like glycosyltransferase